MYKYLTWKGKLDRKEYFLSMSIVVVILVAVILAISPFYPPFKVNGIVTSSIINFRSNLYNYLALPLGYLMICYIVMRFHDLGKSGWYYLC